MSIRLFIAAIALVLPIAPCISRESRLIEIKLNNTTTEISGWFSSRGEWALYPDRSRYDPFRRTENQKCVSIVNQTGKPRNDFSKYNKKFVILQGFALDYDELKGGESAYDNLLSKKYVGSEVVENFCLRKFIFVVKNIRFYK